MYVYVSLVALYVSFANALLDLPALWPDLGRFADPLASGLPIRPQLIQVWQSGTISSLCRDRLVSDNLDPTTFQGYSVSIDDCANPWNFCYQTGSQMSIDDLAHMFSQVPVRMRSWVADVILVAEGSGAYTHGTTTLYRGKPTVEIFIHETTHACEYGQAFRTSGSPTSGWLTDSTEWLSAYASDSAVPDEYARASQHENLAQTPSLIIYDRLTNGKLGDEPDLWKIGNQLNTFVDQADNAPHGGRLLDTANIYCSRRYVSCPRVFAQNGTKVAYEDVILDQQIDSEGIIMEPIPPLTHVTPTNCTF